MASKNGYVCLSCLRALSKSSARALRPQRPPLSPPYGFIRTAARPLHQPLRTFAYSASSKPSISVSPVKHAEDAVQRLVDQEPVPADEQVTETLKTIEAAALALHHQPIPERPVEREPDGSPTSAILSMNSRSKVKPPAQRSTSTTAGESESLSYLAYRLLKHPRVFISPTAIDLYVTIQTMLSRPDSIPEMFNLYATKPQPQLSKTKSMDVTYESPKSDAAASAIPAQAANLALDAAIQIRNLPLALSVIATSFERTAFRKNKFVRKGLPPVLGAGLTPIAAWTLAANMSHIQTGLPEETFTQIAFAGMATYAAAVGTIGYVALTSANDQMRRVTWAVGMPLRERWLREDERAAADRVACAWGFKETGRWGEEEGQNWEQLKEWIGVRGMVLDKVGLMEGME